MSRSPWLISRNGHDNHTLPLLLAGKAGNALKTGRHNRSKPNTPVANLYGKIAIRMGIQLDFDLFSGSADNADSNGGIRELAG